MSEFTYAQQALRDEMRALYLLGLAVKCSWCEGRGYTVKEASLFRRFAATLDPRRVGNAYVSLCVPCRGYGYYEMAEGAYGPYTVRK